MTSRMGEIWDEILEKYCNCYADEFGNRPCDYDATICQKCEDSTILDLFNQKLQKTKKETNTFEVTISDSVTYEVTADNENEAIFMAL